MGGDGGWWDCHCHFCRLVKRGDVKKKMYDVGGYEKKKNAPFKISSALPHFSKHNKCSLSNQTNSFTTQREDKNRGVDIDYK